MTDDTSDLQVQLYHAVVNCDCGNLRNALARGANPNTYFGDRYNNNKTNILIISCERGLIESARILLEAGADASFQDRWGQTALMYGCYSQYQDVVELLLSRQPDIIDIKDRHGKTALHCAIESESEPCVQLLVKYGCDITVTTWSGITPLMTLCRESPSDKLETMMELLINSGANLEQEEFRDYRTALQIATIKKNIRAVKVLLDAGANINTQDKHGKTPITNLIYQNCRRYHIDKHLDSGVIEILDIMIKFGADVNSTESLTSNPLTVSAMMHVEPIVRYLLEHGANKDVKVQGFTTLILSVKEKDISSVKTLLQWKCSTDIKCFVSGKLFDPFELAVEFSSWDIAQVLARAGYNLFSHRYLTSEYWYDDVPEPLQNNQDMLKWLRKNVSCPFTLFQQVLLKLWRLLKPDTDEKLKTLFLPVRMRELISNGNFLTEV